MSRLDEIMREQRRLKEMLGVTGTASAILEAHKASSLAAMAQSIVPRSLADREFVARSLLDRATIGTLGGAIGSRAVGGTIADYLRTHAAPATGSIGGIAGAAALGSLSGLFPNGISETRERLARDMGLAGQLGRLSNMERMIQGDLASVAAARAEMGAAARAAGWARGLLAPAGTLADVLRGRDGLDGQIGRLTRAATDIAALAGLGPPAGPRGALHEATALKLSAFGGSLDLLGPGARLGREAFGSLLGDWRTRADLPRGYWRDPSTRARIYRDAQVDEGLVEARSAEVVEVLVESGVVEGERTSTGVRAVVEVGPLRMAVTAGRPRHGAFQVIDAFEGELRAFVARRLEAQEAAGGQDPRRWFVRRVPGDIVREAKGVRQAAYKAGEAQQPLINFTNLGDLIAVVTRKDNWADVFGAIFGDREGLVVDLRRLNENRRTVMHGRPMDGVRLMEVMLTVRRLTAAMRRDGDTDAGWDDDA